MQAHTESVLAVQSRLESMSLVEPGAADNALDDDDATSVKSQPEAEVEGASAAMEEASIDLSAAVRPCRWFFRRQGLGQCRDGEQCRFSHDRAHYAAFFQLRDCPNGCGNLCGTESQQCRTCHDRALTENRSNIPCRHYFGDDRFCRQGPNCHYSHDEAVYDAYFNLQPCPTPGCHNKCRGRQCSSCHQRYLDRKRSMSDRPLRPCMARGNEKGQEWQCKNMTKFRYCPECYLMQKQY